MLEKAHYHGRATLGEASGQNFATPHPVERPTDAIKEHLVASLGAFGQIIGRIDKEQYRLMGPMPTVGMETSPEKPEGDIPELLYLAREINKRMHYIDARLSFLSEI